MQALNLESLVPLFSKKNLESKIEEYTGGTPLSFPPDDTSKVERFVTLYTLLYRVDSSVVMPSVMEKAGFSKEEIYVPNKVTGRPEQTAITAACRRKAKKIREEIGKENVSPDPNTARYVVVVRSR